MNPEPIIDMKNKLRGELYGRLLAAIIEGTDKTSVLDRILAEFEREFGFRRYLVFYHDKSKDLISILESRGFNKETASQISFLKTAINEAITPKVVDTGEYFFTNDSQSANEINKFWKVKLGFKGPFLALPLTVEHNVCGVLVVNDQQLKKDHAKALLPFADILAVAVTLADKDNRLLARHSTIDLMRHVQSQFVQARVDERGFLDSVAESVAQIMNAPLCSIYRRVGGRSDEDLNEKAVFERRGAFGYPASLRDDRRIAGKGKKAGLTNHALAGELVNVPNVEDDERWSGREADALREVLNSPIRAFLGVPMFGLKKDVIGCITLTRRRVSLSDGLLFRQQDIDLVTAICSAVSSLLDTVDAMEEIKRHHAQLDALFNAVSERLPEEVSVVDTSFNITYVNPAKKKKFWQDQPILGRKCYEVYEKRDAVCPNCPMQDAMRRARLGDFTPVHDTTHFGRPTGAEIYNAAVTASAIADPETGEIVGAVEVVRDLTQEERQVDVQILHGSHKVITALDSIRTRIATIEKQVGTEEIKEFGTLKEHLNMLRMLVDRAHVFLNLWLETVGEISVNLQSHDIAELIRNALADLDVAYIIRSEPEDRQWIIDCDRAMLQSVFHELAVNAIKATLVQEIASEIEVTLKPWIHRGIEHGLHIAFVDNGPGVSPEDKDHIFERFYSKFRDGHGLGLYLCRRFIVAHEGIIKISEQTPGATFDVYLPAKGGMVKCEF